MEYYEYLNYFTLLHAVVIANLVLVAYLAHTFRLMQDALGLVFVTLEQITKGNPVRISIKDNEEINITFPNMDQQDDDDE